MTTYVFPPGPETPDDKVETCELHLERTVAVRKLPAERDRWVGTLAYVEPVWDEFTAAGWPTRMDDLPLEDAQLVHRIGQAVAHRRALRHGELYYATPEFTTLLAGAYESVPLDTLACVPPVACGVVYLQQPLPIGADGFDKPLLARSIAWDVYGDYGDGVPPMLVVFVQAYDQRWHVGRTELGKVAPRDGLTGETNDDYEVTGVGVVAQVGLAAMALLQQENLVETHEHEVEARSRAAKRREAKHGKAAGVKVVRLRKAVRDGMEQAHAAEQDGRERHVRWIVRGHWRQQACGKGRTDRRRIYIAPHYKGPDDGTLVVRTTVFQW